MKHWPCGKEDIYRWSWGNQLVVGWSRSRQWKNSKIRQCIEQGIQNPCGRFFFFFWDFIYLRESKKRKGTSRDRERGGEGQTVSLLSRDPYLGFHPRTQEIMTWAEGRCLTDWTTQVPLGSILKNWGWLEGRWVGGRDNWVMGTGCYMQLTNH